MKTIAAKLVGLAVVAALPCAAPAQSSSPHPTETAAPARASLAAAPLPDPHLFAVQDLVTIIVREATQSDSKSNLDTTKDSNFNGEVKAFPELNIPQMLQGFIRGGDLARGPKVDAD